MVDIIGVDIKKVERRPGDFMEGRTALLVSMFQTSKGKPFTVIPDKKEREKPKHFTIKIHRAAKIAGYSASLKRNEDGSKITVTPKKGASG